MSKVTSKLQVTIPKSIADTYGIVPGSEIIFESAGDGIRVQRVREDPVEYECKNAEIEFKLRLFDEATERQKARAELQRDRPDATSGRGWTREELYDRSNLSEKSNGGAA